MADKEYIKFVNEVIEAKHYKQKYKNYYKNNKDRMRKYQRQYIREVRQGLRIPKLRGKTDNCATMKIIKGPITLTFD